MRFPAQWSMATAVLLASAPIAAQASTVRLRNVFSTTGYVSSDPSGITYLPSSKTFLIVDSEIDETPLYTGANVFEVTRTGILLQTYTTQPFSREPSGVAYDAATGRLWITDDDLRRVFEVEIVDASLRLVSWFSTAPFGVRDPEDIAVDPLARRLYVADGATGGTRSIHEFTTRGVWLGRIDLPPEITDPEGLHYDADLDRFWLASGPQKRLYRIDGSGRILDVLDLLSLRPTYGTLLPKAVVAAPASSGGDLGLYFADYGWDEVNDGRVFELENPDPGGANRPPHVDAGTSLGFEVGVPGRLQGAVWDDGLPAGNLVTVEWRVVDTDVPVAEFTDPRAAATTATFSVRGKFWLELTGSDGQLTARDRIRCVVR